MCINPVSAGLTLAAGTGLSVAGGLGQKNQQISAQARDMAARNAVLQQHLAKEQGYSNEAEGLSNNLIGQFLAPNAEAQDAAALNRRQSFVSGNIVSPSETAAPAGPAGGTDLVKNEMAKRISNAFNQATNQASLNAKLGSYDDAWANRNASLVDPTNKISDLTNLAKSDAALISPEQDLSAYGAYRVPSELPSLMSGAGTLLGGLAGNLFGNKKAPSGQ